MILPAIHRFRLTAAKCFSPRQDQSYSSQYYTKQRFQDICYKFYLRIPCTTIGFRLIAKVDKHLTLPSFFSHKRPTQSIGMLSYTFLRSTSKEDIIVPMVRPILLFLSSQYDYYIFFNGRLLFQLRTFMPILSYLSLNFNG